MNGYDCMEFRNHTQYIRDCQILKPKQEVNVMPEKIEVWRCEKCGEKFSSEQRCITHEKKEDDVEQANEMLRNGATLKEINDKFNFWELPEYLENVTTNHCFIIEYWQCCDKPAYQIKSFQLDGSIANDVILVVRGCGSWTGYYGDCLDIKSSHLKNVHNPDELFVDKRNNYIYGYMMG